MKPFVRFAIPFLLLLAMTACDLEEEILKQLGIDEVDVSVDMFNERDREDAFRVDVVPSSADLDAVEQTGGQYVTYRRVLTIPSGALAHTKLCAMGQMADLAESFGMPPVGSFGTLSNDGAGSADFEVRIYNDDTIEDLGDFLDGSAVLVSAAAGAGETLDLEDVEPDDIEAAYLGYADAHDPDAQGNYHLYVGAASTSALDVTVGEAGLFGYGFFQKTTDMAPGDFSEYEGNIEGVDDLALSGYVQNNSETDEVTVVIAFHEQDAPDHDVAVFLEPERWVLEAVVAPGERVLIEDNPDVTTPYTEELLEWAVVKLTKGRHVQSDVGAWSTGAVDVTLNVQLDSTIDTQLDY